MKLYSKHFRLLLLVWIVSAMSFLTYVFYMGEKDFGSKSQMLFISISVIGAVLIIGSGLVAQHYVKQSVTS